MQRIGAPAPLVAALAALADHGVIPAPPGVLEAGMAAAGVELRATVLREIPAFAASGNPEILPGLERHAGDHLAEILRLFGGGAAGDFAFVRAHAQQRAEQRFPLEAVLHAYRCGHRVFSHWLRAALTNASGAAVPAVADFAIEYVDTVSSIAAAEYVAHTRALAEAEGDRRSELLNILLNGYDESDGRVARLLKRAGYLEQRQAYCVVVAQAVNAAEMERPARAKRIADAIGAALEGTPIRVLAGVRNGLVTAVLSDRRRQSGWTAPQSDVAERAAERLAALGPAVIAGLSGDHPSTSFLPKALNEAAVALDFADVANRVVRFSGLPVRALLVHRGGDHVQQAAPAWAARLIDADARAGGALIATLRAIADSDMNMQEAARRLGKHANTLYARLERIEEVTGLDGRRYHGLTELLLAADCARAFR